MEGHLTKNPGDKPGFSVSIKRILIHKLDGRNRHQGLDRFGCIILENKVQIVLTFRTFQFYPNGGAVEGIPFGRNLTAGLRGITGFELGYHFFHIHRCSQVLLVNISQMFFLSNAASSVSFRQGRVAFDFEAHR